MATISKNLLSAHGTARGRKACRLAQRNSPRNVYRQAFVMAARLRGRGFVALLILLILVLLSVNVTVYRNDRFAEMAIIIVFIKVKHRDMDFREKSWTSFQLGAV